MNKKLSTTIIALTASAMLTAALPLHAETVAEFYKGKTLNLYIGTGESSGAVGAYPHNMSEVIGKYIPGNPTIVVRNMPGAGGIKLANYIYSIAPQDGTNWAFITRGFLLAPLLKLPGVQFDPSKFSWIGSPARTDSVGAVWTVGTPVRTIQDAMKTEVVVGATTLGQGTGVFPTMLNQLIGTKFKVVSGYKSVGDVELAMEKGELQGKIDWTWGSLMSGRTADWVPTNKVALLIQLGLKKSPKIPADVPLALDFAKSQEDRQVMEIVCAPSATGYPSFMGPDVPKNRLEAIRAAFQQTMKDPRFIEILQKQKLELDPIDGDEINGVVKGIYSKPESVVEKMRTLMPPS
jgi:tripartite-type tricarboxylate transporter receptor subunit TctC